MPEISVGIDLGTTNSCISTCWPNGQPRLLRDDAGVGVIPSVVSFTDDGRVEVGQKAKMRLLTDPQNTFLSVKRFIGRDVRTDENRWAASLYAYTIEAGKNGIPMAVTRGRRFPIYQISGSVLRYLKEIAESGIGQEVKKAVITVPANFNEVQRRSTHQAGEFAGFEVLRIFNEPTAAALAYGLGRDRKQIIAVYDFGGGTFDITILRLEDPVFEVMATSGDMLLGGEDFDRRLREDMFDQFKNSYGFNPEDDMSLVQRFTLGAERMKCQLTDWIVTAFEDRHVRDASGRTLPPFHYESNRERFRALVGDLVERSFTVCDEAFKLANMSPKDVDEVILVGGSTRIPFLRERVAEYFGRPPLDKIQPDVVVSMGAAIQAFSLSGGDLVYPAAAGDILPIRKVEPRPPMLKLDQGGAFEILDDLSDDIQAEEDAAIHTLVGMGKTVPGTPPTRPKPSSPPLPTREATSQPPTPPPAKDKTLPWAPPASWPSMTAQSEELGELAEEPAPAQPAGPHDAADTQTFPSTNLLTPARSRPRQDLREGGEMLPVVSPEPGPVESSSDLDTDLPAPFQSPEDLALEPRRPRAVAPPVLAPPADEALGLPARFHPASEKDVQEAMEMTIEALEEKTEEAPVVTPEQAAKPYVTRDVVQETLRVEQTEAAAAAGAPAAIEPGQPEVKPAKAPLLLDVTANTLSVATVGGYVEVLVKKNSPVPIEKRHLFTTGADFQDRAVIKVVEGESNRAEENHNLGEVELVEIRKAPRGEIKIEVMFEITVDGILAVSARNTETGEAQSARLTLFGG